MQKYAALISYVGTDYCGWQRQTGSAADGAPSIQGTFEGALRQLTSEETLSVVGSGRTDSGVHAAGQVAHFILRKKKWDLGILRKGLNSILPQDIQVLAVREVPIEFHAQRSAEKKQYSYYFQQGPCAFPHLEPLSWWIQKPLDRVAMQAGLDHLVGRHDFKAFQSAGAKPGPTVREILEARVEWEEIRYPGITAVTPGTGAPEGIQSPTRMPLGFVRVRLVGTGFLKQMVRSISGTLLQIGEGRRSPDDMKTIIETCDRKSVGPTAPGRALWLERVWYSGIDW